MIGQTLSHYEITAKLGSGGMGVVYRARDAKLDRDVALKMLPPEVAEDPDRLARFEREAKTVAALNHPNIVTIHSVDSAQQEGSEEPVHFLTMELVEGKSLEDLLAKGRMSLSRIFEIATPMADALAAAHDKGVTHRDVKPANVMVTTEGRVKVLDFGLAKLQQEASEAGGSRLETQSITGEGTVLGTVAYMSPEQAEGRAIDARSDIFSLGVVLYEMATGQRPFRGDTPLSTMTSILRDTPPPVTEINAELPRHLGRVIRRCLEKDPLKRYQSARDVTNELADLRSEVDSGEVTTAAPGAAPKSRIGWIVGIGVAASVALIAFWRLGSGPEEAVAPRAPTPSRLIRLTQGPGLEFEPAWSPDGKFLAYTTNEEGNMDVVIQPLGGGKPIRAVEHPADDASPAWSPDGAQLAFVSARDRDGRISSATGLGPITRFILGHGADIYVTPAFGGQAVKVAEDGFYPAWTADGLGLVFNRGGQTTMDLWRVDLESGAEERLTEGPEREFQPAVSPDGEWIAYIAIVVSGNYQVGVRSLDGGESAGRLLDDGAWALDPAWSPDGKLIYYSTNAGGALNVWRLPVETGRGLELGEPEQVTVGSGNDAGADIARPDGQLAYATMSIDADIWELDVETGETRQITFETSSEDYPDLSPDGSTLLVTSDRDGKTALWTFDLEGRALRRLGAVPAFAFGGRWSPDGSEVVYPEGESATAARLVRRDMSSAVSVEMTPHALTPSWSPDGQWIAAAKVFGADDDVGPPVGVVLSRDGGAPRRLTSLDSVQMFQTWSPDGKTIAFNVDESGKRTIWAVAAEGGEPWQITDGAFEDSHPHFCPTDPSSLIFLEDHRNIVLLNLETNERRHLTDYTQPNITLDYPAWSPDGMKIYYAYAESTGDIFVSEQ